MVLSMQIESIWNSAYKCAKKNSFSEWENPPKRGVASNEKQVKKTGRKRKNPI